MQAEGHARAAGTRGAARGRRPPPRGLGREKSPVNASTKCLLLVAYHGGILDIPTGRTRMSGLQNRERPTKWRRNDVKGR